MDDDISEDNQDEESKSVGGKKTLLLIILAVLLLAGVGAGVYFSGLLGLPDSGEEMADTQPEPGEASETGRQADAAPQYDEEGNLIGGPVYYEMPEFLVNLSTTGEKTSFLKMKVTLELSGPDVIPVIDANRPRIEDVFNTYLRELRPSDLSGSAGIYRLREELLMRLNTAIQPHKVNDILFSEIIVQ